MHASDTPLRRAPSLLRDHIAAYPLPSSLADQDEEQPEEYVKWQLSYVNSVWHQLPDDTREAIMILAHDHMARRRKA